MRFLAAGLWAGLIFTLSSIPQLSSGLPQDMVLRKIAHITEFFVLACLLYRAFASSLTWKRGMIFSCIGTLCLLYAISDETHQLFVSGRYSAATDVMIDSIGFFVFLFYFGSTRLRKMILGCALCFVLICPSIATSGEKCPKCSNSSAITVIPVEIQKTSGTQHTEEPSTQ